MKTDAILTPLLNSPKLPAYIAQLQAYLQAEAEKRTSFYEVISEKDKAAFINGKIVFHKQEIWLHHCIVQELQLLLGIYANKLELGVVFCHNIMIHLSRNSYQPDICFFNHEKSQYFTDEQMLFPAPDFIVEVLSKSAEKIDRGIKMQDYAAHGVSEYWIIHPIKRQIEKYILAGEKYRLEKIYTIEDTIKSHAITGFHIEVIAIFERTENMKELQRLIKGEAITEPEGW